MEKNIKTIKLTRQPTQKDDGTETIGNIPVPEGKLIVIIGTANNGMFNFEELCYPGTEPADLQYDVYSALTNLGLTFWNPPS
ncbi:hypothetical protein WMF30_33290 [Sorangium sp. So ce134]